MKPAAGSFCSLKNPSIVLPTPSTRLPRWAVHLLLALATALIGWLTLHSDTAASPYPVLYCLVATCAFCFLKRDEAIAHTALITIVYADTLIVAAPFGGSNPVRWVALTVALSVGGGFIGTLRRRHDRLLDALRSVSPADPVSGLLNRRGFDEAFANELHRARRSGSRFAVLVGSIDGFTDIPDARRKEIIGTVGAAITSAKRGIDTAARLGTDEFAILVTYTDEDGAALLAERVRAALRQTTTSTMSIGVVSHPRHGASMEMLMRAARDASGDAMALGGDRSVIADSAADSIDARMSEPDVRVVQVAG